MTNNGISPSLVMKIYIKSHRKMASVKCPLLWVRGLDTPSELECKELAFQEPHLKISFL